jgi:hypothetical protein
MGKKRFFKQSNLREETVDFVRIIEGGNNKIFYEIEDILTKNENKSVGVTEDTAEIVAILMRKGDNINKNIWNKEFTVDIESIDVRKCLYWLSGGDREWVTLNYYNRPWNECDNEFAEEFEYLVKWIIKKSKTLGDIKKSFIEHLNLPVLYEFAINKNFVK